MNKDALEIYINPKTDWHSPNYQRDIGELADIFRKNNIDFEERAVVRKAEGFENLVVALAFGIPVLKHAAEILKTWITARAGRTIKLKTGSTELEASSVSEIDELIKLLGKIPSDLEKVDIMPKAEAERS